MFEQPWSRRADSALTIDRDGCCHNCEEEGVEGEVGRMGGVIRFMFRPIPPNKCYGGKGGSSQMIPKYFFCESMMMAIIMTAVIQDGERERPSLRGSSC